MKHLNSCVSVMLCAIMCGCSVDRRVEDAYETLRQTYDNLPDYEKTSFRELTWTEACKLALAQNIELQQSAHDIEKARYEVRKVYLDVIPLVNLGFYYNKYLFGGGNNYYDSRDHDYDINVIFNLPSLTQLPMNRYTALLSLFRAEKNYDLKRRDVTARLYKLARLSALAGEQYRADCTDAEYRHVSTTQLERQREISLRSEWKEWGTLFNDFRFRWKIKSESIPRMNWRRFRSCSRKPDRLVLMNMALELEASRLRKLGITLNYWPVADVHFYSPRLFNMSGGHDSGFMSGGSDVRMDMNFYLRLDTQLKNYQALKQAKKEYSFLLDTLRNTLLDRREKILALVESGQEYEEWRDTMVSYKEFLSRMEDRKPATLRRQMEEGMKLERDCLVHEKEQVERECAMILEYGLPGEDS
ncbi:TolC family protein [Akkermansia sp. N21116]|uniref:TolC family protein n=1 Tax=Akkermansia sp. N21116 TaxID=3040764 RepID=UPI00244EDA65|nr:TolC family protein [Akkermansia sp. N21116]WPX39978.1 TolC family protein [Akkermansia sp. N21116]